MTSYFADDILLINNAYDLINVDAVKHFENYMNLLLKGIQIETFDTRGLFTGDYNGNIMQTLYDAGKETNFEEMTVTEQSIAFFCAEAELRDAAAGHFSIKGCEQKFKAAKAQLESYTPVTEEDSKWEILRSVILGIINSLWYMIKNFFSNFFTSVK